MAINIYRQLSPFEILKLYILSNGDIVYRQLNRRFFSPIIAVWSVLLSTPQIYMGKKFQQPTRASANAMKHLQARFTKSCNTSLLFNSILATVVVKFRQLKRVIALKYSLLKMTNMR